MAQHEHTTPPEVASDRPDADAPRRYDGIICFGGEDWWYHNRGHYDMRMMRGLSADAPVLYVNSIGMRMPRPTEGRMFAKRVSRKLRSLRRGLVRIDERFAVLTAPSVPGRAADLSRPFVARSIRRAAATMGIKNPLIWVACPTAADLLDRLPHVGLVYQRTDRYEDFMGVDAAAISARDRALKHAADMVIYCSGSLLDDETPDTPDMPAVLVDHGVNANRFVAASDHRSVHGPTAEPDDIASLPHPRVGFVGAIDPHTFDPELFRGVVARMPQASFVLVGGSTLPEGWCPASNCHLLGQRDVDAVADYMAACDVLIMPWRRSRWIDACHPVKLKEYLATGRPIVSTPFRELGRYPGLVRVASNADGFADEIRQALAQSFDAAPGRDRVAGQTWRDQADAVRRELVVRGLAPVGMPLRGANEIGLGNTDTPIAHQTGRLVAATLDVPPPATDDSATDPHVLTGPIGHVNAGALPMHDTQPRPAGDGSVDLVLHPARPIHELRLPTGELPIRTAIILAGGVWPTPLQEVLDRNPADFWVSPDGPVLDAWIDRVRDATASMPHPLPVRLAANGAIPAPWPSGRPDVHVEQDPHPFRGPAGVVADLARGLPEDQHVIVGEAARWIDCSLSAMIADHLASNAAVTIARNPDGSPAGVYLIRGDALALVPVAGYVDIKEQWLPSVRQAGLPVLVHQLDGRGAMPLRTRDQLLEAARVARRDRPRVGLGPSGDPALEPLRAVCRGAIVGPDAGIFDSIIMPGAYVGPRATVIRSIVGPDTVVPPDHVLSDCVFHAGRMLAEQPRGFRAA
ncbi:MAG: glycosyltransferase [Phycisphaerales bacterium]